MKAINLIPNNDVESKSNDSTVINTAPDALNAKRNNNFLLAMKNKWFLSFTGFLTFSILFAIGYYWLVQKSNDVVLLNEGNDKKITSLVVKVASSPSATWTCICSDSTGKYLTAGSTEIYRSEDYGVSWQQTTAPSLRWTSIISDSSGQKLVATYGSDSDGNIGNIYKSTDYGFTWQLTNAPMTRWTSVASSSTGQRLAAVAANKNIYTSNDFGNNWNISTALSGFGWFRIASDSSGQYLTAVCDGDPGSGNPGPIYSSTDFGISWTQVFPPHDCWYAISSSASGQFKAAALCNGHGGIYISNDYGYTWTPSDAPVSAWYSSIASDSSGKYLVATSYNSGIYTSNNYGSSWTYSSAPSGVWVGAASDASGQYLAAIEVQGGFIWRSFDYGVTWSNNPIFYQPTYQPSGIPMTPSMYPTMANNAVDYLTVKEAKQFKEELIKSVTNEAKKIIKKLEEEFESFKDKQEKIIKKLKKELKNLKEK